MTIKPFNFQQQAIDKLHQFTELALHNYAVTHTPQVISFTAPTGAGKTIIMASLIEDVYCGTADFAENPHTIFVWLSDSPELNEQSRMKIDGKADRIQLQQCVTIDDDSFDSEMLDDGKIYFLNTQKIGKGKKLTKHGDGRTYTIWETLRNTVERKSDRLIFIIDEAHRGMKGLEASRATTIMQKFLKGSKPDDLPAMPLVIGMSATIKRFNDLVGDVTSTLHRVKVEVDDVRQSGLLKDHIQIHYPDTRNNDMAVLQAAADEWLDKWQHWEQYCREQHYAYVNPIFVVQVQNGSNDLTSATELDECLRRIQERTGMTFTEGEVVHTFGQTGTSLTIAGVSVRHIEASRINESRNIKVVFFKENLSTGWDCPRAETMMSFRRATDSTYIAQLLGRMIRTPMQMRINVDETLNYVHLFLPYFDEHTVQKVVDDLNSESGTIPSDVSSSALGTNKTVVLTVKPPIVRTTTTSATATTTTTSATMNTTVVTAPVATSSGESSNGVTQSTANTPTAVEVTDNSQPAVVTNPPTAIETPTTVTTTPAKPTTPVTVVEPKFDREEVVKFINDLGILTYEVRTVKINSYLKSLLALSHLLTISGLYSSAKENICNEIVEKIHNHIDKLKQMGKYDALRKQVLEFKLKTRTFDVVSGKEETELQLDLFSTTDTDVDRQLRMADAKMQSEGIPNIYGAKFYDDDNPLAHKIDVIIFVNDEDCMRQLEDYAETRFHNLKDEYRLRVLTLNEKLRKQYDDIVRNGDIVSEHNFRLPEYINVNLETGGKLYDDHLFVDEKGYAMFKLNSWEDGLLQIERQRDDFVCWLRNPSRGAWALCFPYEMNDNMKEAYPDFLIVRKDPNLGKYVVDILEPHDQTRTDNLPKAKGMAEYAKKNTAVGRIQLIHRKANGDFVRLDLARSIVQNKIKSAHTDEELTRLFDEYGE